MQTVSNPLAWVLQFFLDPIVRDILLRIPHIVELGVFLTAAWLAWRRYRYGWIACLLAAVVTMAAGSLSGIVGMLMLRGNASGSSGDRYDGFQVWFTYAQGFHVVGALLAVTGGIGLIRHLRDSAPDPSEPEKAL